MLCQRLRKRGGGLLLVCTVKGQRDALAALDTKTGNGKHLARISGLIVLGDRGCTLEFLDFFMSTPAGRACTPCGSVTVKVICFILVPPVFQVSMVRPSLRTMCAAGHPWLLSLYRLRPALLQKTGGSRVCISECTAYPAAKYKNRQAQNGIPYRRTGRYTWFPRIGYSSIRS